MPAFPIAHLTLHEVQLVIVFLATEFDDRSAEDKLRFYSGLQARAAREGLAGEPIAVWQDRLHRTKFIAPPQQHSFFQIVKYNQLRAQVNRSLESF